jgi:hypothetical protein
MAYFSDRVVSFNKLVIAAAIAYAAAVGFAHAQVDPKAYNTAATTLTACQVKAQKALPNAMRFHRLLAECKSDFHDAVQRGLDLADRTTECQAGDIGNDPDCVDGEIVGVSRGGEVGVTVAPAPLSQADRLKLSLEEIAKNLPNRALDKPARKPAPKPVAAANDATEGLF